MAYREPPGRGPDETRLVEIYATNGAVELAPAVDALRVALQGTPRPEP